MARTLLAGLTLVLVALPLAVALGAWVVFPERGAVLSAADLGERGAGVLAHPAPQPSTIANAVAKPDAPGHDAGPANVRAMDAAVARAEATRAVGPMA